MLASFYSYLQFGSTFTSLEISSIGDREIYYAVTAKRKKGEFVDLEFVDDDLENLQRAFGKGQHCYVTINSDKVLTKEVPFEQDIEKLVAKTFPSFSSESFFYDVLKCGSKCFIAICRKEYVNECISKIESKGLQVLGFNLSFFVISNLVPLIKSTRVETSKLLLETDGSLITSYKRGASEEISYTIEDIEVSSKFLVALGGLFSYIKEAANPKNSEVRQGTLIQLYREKTFFKKGLRFTAVFFLIFFVVSFIASRFYTNELQLLERENQTSQVQKEQLDQKKGEMSDKQALVDKLASSGNSKSSFYVNQIVTSSPSTIRHDLIEFQPLIGSIRFDKPIKLQTSVLVIAGESANKEEFTLWIDQLEEMSWIRKVTVVKYGIEGENDLFKLNVLVAENDS